MAGGGAAGADRTTAALASYAAALAQTRAAAAAHVGALIRLEKVRTKVEADLAVGVEALGSLGLEAPAGVVTPGIDPARVLQEARDFLTTGAEVVALADRLRAQAVFTQRHPPAQAWAAECPSVLAETHELLVARKAGAARARLEEARVRWREVCRRFEEELEGLLGREKRARERVTGCGQAIRFSKSRIKGARVEALQQLPTGATCFLALVGGGVGVAVFPAFILVAVKAMDPGAKNLVVWVSLAAGAWLAVLAWWWILSAKAGASEGRGDLRRAKAQLPTAERALAAARARRKRFEAQRPVGGV